MPGHFVPPDHSRGDANTLGGYAAVHARPAAFEGPDGISYSVEILAEATGDRARPWGAYLLFMRWARQGAQRVEGHLETPFLAWGTSERDALAQAGAMPLAEVQTVLETMIAAARAEQQATERPARRWWDVMRDDDARGDEA